MISESGYSLPRAKNMAEFLDGKIQEHFAKKIPGNAFPIIENVARSASGDAIFRSALGIFKVVKWNEIDAISCELRLLDTALMSESDKQSINLESAAAKKKFTQISESARTMMGLLHPSALGHLQLIESSFSEAYKIGSVDLQDVDAKVGLMRDIVAGFCMYSKI